ncbi:GstE2.2 family protein [Megaselia abdita]
MSRPKIYGAKWSPPVRSNLMVFAAIGVDYELVNLDIFKQENLEEEYLKKNPVHSIPLFVDGDVIIRDSHSISSYLVDKYSSNDSLYPKDLVKRALVNERLFFDTGILFVCLRAITCPLFFNNVVDFPEEKITNLRNAFDMMEKFLGQTKFIAGDNVTIADISCVATVSTLVNFVEITPSDYPKLHKWFNVMKGLEFYKKENQIGSEWFSSMIKEKIANVKSMK